MARLSRDEHEDLLRQIADGTNAPPEIMELIQKLRDDFDESLQVDTREVTAEWEEKYNSAVRERDQAISERDKSIGERDEARRQYRERFFNAREEAEQIVDRQKADSPKGLKEVLNLKEVI